MLTRAIQNAIANNVEIAAGLATWDFGSGLAPAVFTTDPAPADCRNPVVVIVETGGSEGGSRGTVIDYVDHSIKIWGDKTGSDDLIRALAYKIQMLLHRAALTGDGITSHRSVASIPASMKDPDGYPGYMITVNSLLIRT